MPWASQVSALLTIGVACVATRLSDGGSPTACFAASAIGNKLRLSVASSVTFCADQRMFGIHCVCTLYAGANPLAVRMKRASGSGSLFSFSKAACTALESITTSSCASAASSCSR